MAGFDWGSAIGAVASLGSAYLGSRAASNSGKDATNASNASNDLQWRMFNESNRLNEPFYNTGVAANNQLAALLGLPSGGTAAQAPNYVAVNAQGVPIANAQLYDTDPNYRNAWDSVANNHQRQYNTGYWNGSDRNWIQNEIASRMPAPAASTSTPSAQTQQSAFDAFRNTPGYQAGMSEMLRGVQSGAAARGQLNSGKTLLDLSRRSGDYFDQMAYRPYVSDLMQISGRGQATAGQQGQMGLNVAGSIGQNLQNASQQRQNSTYAAANAWQDGLNGVGYFTNRMGQNNGWWGG